MYMTARKKKILVVDDSRSFLTYITVLLKKMGFFKINLAESGMEAIKLMKIWHPDIIILDLMMPGMDGLGTLRAIRNSRQTAEVPVIMVTASRDERKKKECIRMGANQVIFKPVTLGERITPLLPVPRLGKSLGLSDLWIKDESHLPTGSFKSRGLSMAVTMAHHFGIRRLAIPTAGNAGGAMAAYAARAGLEAFVFMPEDTPIINQMECALAGAKTFLVAGLINDCGAIVRAGIESMGWFDCAAFSRCIAAVRGEE